MPQLSAAAKRISSSIVSINGKMEISEKSMAQWVGDFDSLPTGQRAELATELVAMAVALQREGGAPYANAVMQLCQLTSYLVARQSDAQSKLGAKSAAKSVSKAASGTTPSKTTKTAKAASKDVAKKPAAKVSKKK